MTIKFTCTCGKRLRARDEMAARRTFCPRCGRPVGVPSKEATARGTDAAPLSPLERQRMQFRSRAIVPGRAEPAPAPDPSLPPDVAEEGAVESRERVTARPPATVAESIPAPQPLDANLLRLVFTPRHQRRQEPSRIEKWNHCIAYPFRTLWIILGLAGALTALIAATVLLLPRFFELEAEPVWVTLLLLPCVSIPLAIIGYTFGYLESVLASAAAGEAEPLRKAARNLGPAARSSVYWIICFLAGPIVPAGLAVFFWINSGDLQWIDWAILAELGVVAGAYWFFVMLSVSRAGRLRDVNPVVVFDLIDRLGLRAIVLVLVTSASLITHVVLAILALETFHEEPAAGVALLFAALTSGLFWATFFFRLLGVWCYRLRIKLEVAEEPA